jgi:predicted dehydrogenase
MANPRIMLIGAGSMGSNHARVTAASARADLAVIVDPREGVVKPMADRYGAEWMAEPDFSNVDAVIVAAATEAHPDIAKAVLEAGKPMLLEKPLAAGIDESRVIVELSKAKGVPLMCGFVERYNPAVVTARALISQPVYVTAQRHSPYAPRILTGVSWDLLVHDVDLAIQLLGSTPTDVNSTLGVFNPNSLPGAEDLADVLMSFESGAMANISAARIGQKKVRTLTIHEVDRLIELDLLRRDVTVYHHVSGQALTDEGRGYRQQTIIEIPELVTSQEPLSAQLDRFVDVLQGKVDADAERASILPSHEVIAQVKG